MKMTREERSWVLYDVGNSAFVLLVSTIMPLYFNHLAGSAGLSDSDYLAYWGYAASIATIIVAVMGSVTGTMADMKGFKKFLFTISMLVGMFQGGVQALSRSYFAKIIPAEQAGEYFGLMDICGKGAAFLGTTVVGVVTQITGSMSKGVGMISVFFVIGIVFFNMAMKIDNTCKVHAKKKRHNEEPVENMGGSYKYPIDIV